MKTILSNQTVDIQINAISLKGHIVTENGLQRQLQRGFNHINMRSCIAYLVSQPQKYELILEENIIEYVSNSVVLI
ncbi:hypothetical protein J0S82_019771, partial [Galemys pyrenaicus]